MRHEALAAANVRITQQVRIARTWAKLTNSLLLQPTAYLSIISPLDPFYNIPLAYTLCTFAEPSRGLHTEHQAPPEPGRARPDSARVRVRGGFAPEEQH